MMLIILMIMPRIPAILRLLSAILRYKRIKHIILASREREIEGLKTQIVALEKLITALEKDAH
ncbi:hypothetical protein [Avibacterium sp. 21-599]|uniref:hypothetical protein n=1 Tax=Avibacterium sp. 21-599 TaxID=2911528 RepID=UPI0022470FFA|nr:hypothetical protein [Avibacterium sp. 21-599]MCW9717444.1 hypothetical protein [Avibacterium sp. 21-599]